MIRKIYKIGGRWVKIKEYHLKGNKMVEKDEFLVEIAILKILTINSDSTYRHFRSFLGYSDIHDRLAAGEGLHLYDKGKWSYMVYTLEEDAQIWGWEDKFKDAWMNLMQYSAFDEESSLMGPKTFCDYNKERFYEFLEDIFAAE